MSNWKLVNKVFLYDGTFEGFLSLVFYCFTLKTLPQKIYQVEKYCNNFLETTITIETDYNKSKRVFDGIHNNISFETLYNSFYAFLSDQKDKELNILKYLCDGFELGPKINSMLTVPYVFSVLSMKKRACSECHKLKGLVRFMEISNNIYYSSIHPDNNIIEPLGQHFIKRIPNQNFIIHDKNRNLCFLYNCSAIQNNSSTYQNNYSSYQNNNSAYKNNNSTYQNSNFVYQIIDGSNFKLPKLSDKEKYYEVLWKVFFETIAIKERKNPRCQMQFMPKKYWNDLIENP